MFNVFSDVLWYNTLECGVLKCTKNTKHYCFEGISCCRNHWINFTDEKLILRTLSKVREYVIGICNKNVDIKLSAPDVFLEKTVIRYA